MIRAACLALALAACGAPPRPAVQALPADARLVDPASGATFAPAERYRGHVVVLDFWAGWCEECRKQVPALARLAHAFEAEGLVVVGVNAGEPADDAKHYAHDLGITFPIALDPDLAYSDRLDAANLPVLLVIGRDGAIVHRSRHLDDETLTTIRQLVAR